MKNLISAGLASFLDDLCQSGRGGHYYVIDLYTITLVSGVVLRWAAWPLPITFPTTGIYDSGSSVGGNTRASGQTYSASGPYLDRSRLKQALKLEVAQISMTLRANLLMTVNGVPVLQQIEQGYFGGATVAVDRLFAQTANPLDLSLGTMNWFYGQVAEVEELGRAHAVLTVKCPLALLSSPHPRNLYTPGCRHVLFDAGCTLLSSAWLVAGVVQSGSSTVTINTNLTQKGTIPAPTAGPALSEDDSQDGVNLPAETYFVKATYVGNVGESLPSPEVYLGIASHRGLLVVDSPTDPSITGVTQWNCYVGVASGDEFLQNPVPIPFGTAYELSGNGLSQGTPPPSVPTSGWFSQGQIKFTSGACNGLSRFVSLYTNPGSGGIITVIPPLPVAPSASDTFQALPGCDKQMTTCQQKFGGSYAIRYAGCPYIPTPEQGAV